VIDLKTMKTTKTMAFALAFCGAAFAGKGSSGAVGGQEVAVYVDDHASIAAPLMYRATTEAAAIFAGVGVRVAWKAGKPPQERRNCGVIVLTIAEFAPRDLDPAIRAVTELNHGSITVFYDRIRPMLANWLGLVSTLLAQVFAHEIGHSLQGLKRHSETGTMKPHWTIADYRAMQDGQLRFTPLDAGLIRAGVAVNCPAAANAHTAR
jgi:hypothetical protein